MVDRKNDFMKNFEMLFERGKKRQKHRFYKAQRSNCKQFLSWKKLSVETKRRRNKTIFGLSNHS